MGEVSASHAYRVTWSAEDGEHVGLSAEYPSLSWLASTPEEALSGIRRLVADSEENMRSNGEDPPDPADEVRRLARLLRRELEAEGLGVEETAENGEPVLIVGEMKVYPRRLLEGQVAEAGDPDAVDLDWLAKAHRTYFRNLRRFHPSLVTPGRDGRRSGLTDV